MFRPSIVLGLCLNLFPSVVLAQTAGMLSVQGYLKQGDQPVPSTIDVQFRIYDQQSDIPTPANLVDMDGDGASEDVVGEDAKQVLAVAVSLQGVFSTKFGPVSPKAFDGTSRYLEIRVRPAGGGAFVTLSRTEMATAPATAEQVNRPVSGANAIVTASNGNVGIGSTTPDAKLHVVGDSGSAHAHIEAAPTAPFGSVLSIDARALAGGKEFWIFSTGGAAGEGQGKLLFTNHDAGNAILMAFDSTANNVGIGTFSPSNKLSVLGSADISGNVGIGTANPQSNLQVNCGGCAAGSGPDIGLGASGGPMANIGGILRSSEGGNDRGDIVFRTRPEAPASTLDERVRIRADGLIGVGTSGPEAILHLHHSTNALGLPAVVVDSSVAISSPVVDIRTTREDNANVLRILCNSDSSPPAPVPFEALLVKANGEVYGRYGLIHGPPSDVRLKKEIRTIPDALRRVLGLRGVNYRWKHPPERRDQLEVGLIAQEVEKEFPEAVTTARDGHGTKAVLYDRLVGALVEAIKEQNGEIELLRRQERVTQARLAALEARLSKTTEAMSE